MKLVMILLAICVLIALAIRFFKGLIKLRLQPLTHQSERLLQQDEYLAAQYYLSTLPRNSRRYLDFFYSIFQRGKQPCLLISEKVYQLRHAINRYGLSIETTPATRFYLDLVEIHLPPRFESFITNENDIEFICTQHLPLVVSLNGHNIKDYSVEQLQTRAPESRISLPASSIRQVSSNSVEMLNIRKETLNEYKLQHSTNQIDAFLLCGVLILLFLSLLIPSAVMGWVAIPALIIAFSCCWFRYRNQAQLQRRDIKCMRGIPRCWELFSEANHEQNNISLGVIDLHYPEHWHPYIYQNVGQLTDIDIDNDGNVVRQGPFLSLDYEVKHFPLQIWRRNAILTAGSAIILLMMTSLIPMDMPFKISLAWLNGINHIDASSVEELTQSRIKIGDTLQVNGKGMCSIPGTYEGNRAYGYMPFDCSAVYWNQSPPVSFPRSAIIDKTQELKGIITSQFAAKNDNHGKLNPQLASAIEQSGMVLLSNFDKLVNKTNELCAQPTECNRLKNALMNLQNTSNWEQLVNKAQSGALKGLNVLLRPTSARNLELLVNDATKTFITQETRKSMDLLNSPPQGGFLFINDNGQPFVDLPPPDIQLFELAPEQQWHELQRISEQLLDTHFTVSGIVTALHKDANGTLHVTIHDTPDNLMSWQYSCTALLFLFLIGCLIVNSYLTIKRIKLDKLRLKAIQSYYDRCFNHGEETTNPLPDWF